MEGNELIKALANALAPHMGNGLVKADGTPDVDAYTYAAGGLFGTCDADPVLINAMVGPFGYGGVIPWSEADTENEIVDQITYIGSSGYSQSDDCAACGTPTIRKCAQSTCFGRVCQGTEEMVVDRMGLRANTGVQKKVLYGNITDPQGNVLFRQGQTIDNIFTLQVGAAAYNLRRRVGTLMWNGDPANNAGGYEEPTGFDLLINTGKIDTRSGLACDALDSVIYAYGNSVVGATGSPSIVSAVASVVRSIRYRIMTAGFNDDAAAIRIVMHPTLWDCVAAAWACDYGLTCNSWTSDGLRQMNNDALAVAELRDKFWSTKQLPIDGRLYPVVLDNGIEVTNLPYGDDTKRCSDIYVMTERVPGAPNGGQVIWGEYQDFNKTVGPTIGWIRQMFGGTMFDVTDGGRYIVAYDTEGGLCFDVKTLVKFRMRVLVPQWQGRVTNVCCVPLGTYPDVTGSGGTYEVDGGPTTSPEPYLYGDCFEEGGGEQQ